MKFSGDELKLFFEKIFGGKKKSNAISHGFLNSFDRIN